MEATNAIGGAWASDSRSSSSSVSRRIRARCSSTAWAGSAGRLWRAGTADARGRAGASGGGAWQQSGGNDDLAADQCVDLRDRAGRALAGRPLGDLDTTGRERAGRHRQDPGHAEQLCVGELDAWRFVAVVVEDLATGLDR